MTCFPPRKAAPTPSVKKSWKFPVGAAPFKDHPFKVKDDEAMMETADSIRQYGVLVPAIARRTRTAAMNW